MSDPMRDADYFVQQAEAEQHYGEAATLPTIPPWPVAATVSAILARSSATWLTDVAALVPAEHRPAFFAHLEEVLEELGRRDEVERGVEVLEIWEARS